MAALKSLADLEKVGGIVSEKPVKKSVKWMHVDPETAEEQEYEADVFLLKAASGTFVDIFKTLNADVSSDEAALWISKCMVFEDEKGKFKPIGFELARRLEIGLRAAVWKEIRLLCGLEKKTSPPSTNSSASSSPEALAEEQSQKQENG